MNVQLCALAQGHGRIFQYCQSRMTAAVLRSHMRLHLQSLPTTQGVNQIIFLSILHKMNISKLAIPVLQSAALSVSTAWIFLFSLLSFRRDFSLPSPKQQPLWRYSSLLCLLKYWPLNLCAGGQGRGPLSWCMLTILLCTSCCHSYFTHTPSALAWRKTPSHQPHCLSTGTAESGAWWNTSSTSILSCSSHLKPAAFW